MRTYVVTDLQKDFFDPKGRLSVSGADVFPERVAAAMKNFDTVIFTLDWHPADHCSFAPQGGPWPEHCVQYTDGAALPFEAVKAAQGLDVHYFFKGRNKNKEEYGAFARLSKEFRDVFDKSDEIVICGLCGDYCVGETIKNIVKAGYGSRLKVDMDCTGSIDDGSTIASIIKEFNLKTI